jgi:TatD-related deoxyribonuclease
VAGIAGLPVVDHHCHLSLRGEGIAAVARFAAQGGTHLFVATQAYEPKPPLALDDYRRQFEATVELVARAARETTAVAYAVVAPYPVDLVRAAPELGLRGAVELHERALDLAGAFVRERRAVALGEVGRPHFTVEPELQEAARTLFRRALEVAREADCPVVVHSEDLDGTGYQQLAEEAARARLPAAKVIKHYARDATGADGAHGIPRSYLARRATVRAAFREPAPWFLETDFLDDPARPGAVLDLATVPRRARAVADDPHGEADRLWVPFVESVEKVYGFRPEPREKGG